MLGGVADYGAQRGQMPGIQARVIEVHRVTLGQGESDPATHGAEFRGGRRQADGGYSSAARSPARPRDSKVPASVHQPVSSSWPSCPAAA